MIYPESSISHCSLVSVWRSVGGAGVQPFSQVWGRREGCQKTTRIFPTYMFLLFLFREASSSSARSVPLICGENRDNNVVWVSRGCCPSTEHRAPAACKEPADPQSSIPDRAPRSSSRLLSGLWGEAEGQLSLGAEYHFRRPGWQANRDPDRLLLCDLSGHCLFLTLYPSVSTTKTLVASSGLGV